MELMSATELKTIRKLNSSSHLGLLIIVPISKKKVERALTLALVGLKGVEEGALILLLEKVEGFFSLLPVIS